MSFSNIKPTKPELDNLKKRKEFLIKGKSLLEIKKEQLLAKVWDIYRKYHEKREIIKENLQRSYQYLNNSYQKVGKIKIEMLSQFNRIHFQTYVDLDYMNDMGIVVPKIKPIIHETKFPAYSFIDTPIDMDRLSMLMKKLFDELIELAEIDAMLFHFAFYYKKISRRITGMETVVIPKLEIIIKAIEEILEDLNQEEFVKIRKIKNLLENNRAVLEINVEGGID